MPNGKYYCPPPGGDPDLKTLLQFATASGVGQKASQKGEAVTPWTADALAAAVSQAEPGGSTVDLRTVQRWLSPQGNSGISVPNIRRLALVFGAGDPSDVRVWQVALIRARDRTRSGQRAVATDSAANDPAEELIEDTSRVEADPAPGPARLWESWFSGDGALKLSILIWTAYTLNGLVNGILGLLSVSYNATPDLSKEVGFVWAPTWTMLPVVILPLFVIRVSHSLSHWRHHGRRQISGLSEAEDHAERDAAAWNARIDGTAFPFWVIIFLCLGGVFLAQWVGICLRLYAEGDAGIYQVDRNLLTLVRPDYIGQGASALVSMFGYLYSALYVFIFLTALMFMFVMARDYEVLAGSNHTDEIETAAAIREGSWISISVFDAALLIGWAAISIKLQAAYLSSDAPNIAVWLLRDLAGALRFSSDVNGGLPNTSVSHFTTFLMVAVGNFALFVCAARISRGQVALCKSAPDGCTPERPRFRYVPWRTFILVQGFLVVSLISVGQLQGFSLALLCCLALSLWSLIRRRARFERI